MTDLSYIDPVAQLLHLGDPREMRVPLNMLGLHRWCNYPAQFGLSVEHIPELIRMATDENLNMAMSDSQEVWAPLHAWRALGQLKAEEAIAPLLTLLHRIDDNNDDWVSDDLPDALAMMGPAAIPPIAAYLANPQNKLWARGAAARSLSRLGVEQPQAREACIGGLSTALENYLHNDESLNAYLISGLADLEAVEAAPLVEQAFKSGLVDESVMGGWTDFQVEVGLLDESAIESIIENEEGPVFNPFFRSTNDPISKPPKNRDQKMPEKDKRAKPAAKNEVRKGSDKDKQKEAKPARKRHRKKK